MTRPHFKTPDIIEQHRLLTRAKIRGTMRECLRPINAANLRAAHAMLESGTAVGKLYRGRVGELSQLGLSSYSSGSTGPRWI